MGRGGGLDEGSLAGELGGGRFCFVFFFCLGFVCGLFALFLFCCWIGFGVVLIFGFSGFPHLFVFLVLLFVLVCFVCLCWSRFCCCFCVFLLCFWGLCLFCSLCLLEWSRCCSCFVMFGLFCLC